jgi:hypothetical protein
LAARTTQHIQTKQEEHTTREKEKQKEICVSNPKEIQSIFSFGC